MTPAENWKSFFIDWPESFPRSGVLLTTLNETIPFRNFWLKGDLLLFERTVPDALGGRFMLLGFEIVNSVKFTNPLTDDCINQAGFSETCSQELQPALC